MPVVSVVVPNYNHARFLRKRLDSIFQQTFQDFEVILLDDCSKDESQTILKEYARDLRVRLEFSETNSGSTFKQWNKGVRLATGNYVWIAESDDYADERLLGRLAAVLDAKPRVAFAYSRSRQVLADGTLNLFGDWYMCHWDPARWAQDFCMDGREMCERYFSRTNPVPNASAVLFRRAAYDQAGGADETLRICGDWKLWAGMALGGEVAYIGEVMNYFRVHRNSVREQTRLARNDVAEHLYVTRWILDHIAISTTDLEEICEFNTVFWVPAIMSLSVPLSLKRKVLREVIALDPHPLRHALVPALTEIRLKIQRHWRELNGRPA